jgi:hypothetical protein
MPFFKSIVVMVAVVTRQSTSVAAVIEASLGPAACRRKLWNYRKAFASAGLTPTSTNSRLSSSAKADDPVPPNPHGGQDRFHEYWMPAFAGMTPAMNRTTVGLRQT